MKRFGVAIGMLALTACSDPSGPRQRPGDTTDPTSPPTADPIGTGLQRPGQIVDPCAAPLPPGPLPVDTIQILTEEDFDFDALGYLVYQQDAIVATNADGDFQVIAPAPPGDPAGLQVLSTNDLVMVSDLGAAMYRIDRDTGASTLLAAGGSIPNGLEVGENDRVYISDTPLGLVRWYDIATDTLGTVADDVWDPDNLVLSNDEQTLYVATGWGITAYARIDEDTWDAAPIFLDTDLGRLTVVEIDVCDNLYSVVDNLVYRIPRDGGEPESIAHLPLQWPVSSIRWGNGVGGFPRDTLYATNRNVIYAIPVGIEGRRHPTDP